MELATLAFLADHLDDELSWIPRAVLNGRQPSEVDMQALIDLLADVTVLEEQLSA